MKQFLLAIIAFFILISVYTVVTSLQSATMPEVEKKVITPQTNPITETNITKVAAPSLKVEENPVVVKPKAKPYISTTASKRLFLKNTTEAIQKIKSALDAEHQTVYDLSLKTVLTPDESKVLTKLKNKYRLETTDALLQRLKTHPISIVIAQAALETGWGSSRFYREANNIFGIWSFNKNEPRIAAGEQREGKKTIYVKKYPNLEASIAGYYRMISRGRAYKTFRKARLESDNPFELITYLDHYSELRHEYVKRLYFVIKSNKFYELDDPVYQPPGWSNIKAADPKYLLPKEQEIVKIESNTTVSVDTNISIDANNTTQEHNLSISTDSNTSNGIHLEDKNSTIDIVKHNEDNQSVLGNEANRSKESPNRQNLDINKSSAPSLQELNTTLIESNNTP